jgi:hypothetical protein
MWCWRRMEKIGWTDHVRNEEVLHRVKEERNILHTIQRSKANWIGHILRRNCFLKHVIEVKLEGRIEMTGRRGRRRKQLLDDLKEKRRYWKLKEEALHRTLWRTRFGRGYGPVVRQTTEWMNYYYYLTSFLTSLNKISVHGLSDAYEYVSWKPSYINSRYFCSKPRYSFDILWSAFWCSSRICPWAALILIYLLITFAITRVAQKVTSLIFFS